MLPRKRRASACSNRLKKFLSEKLRLKVNRSKSAVDRPWKRKFLGYSVTVNRKPKLRAAPESVRKLKKNVKEVLRNGRGRSVRQTKIGRASCRERVES